METDWMVVKNAETKRFEARFPEITAPTDLPEYVSLSAGSAKEVLRSSRRFGASGHQIFVSGSSLLPDRSKVTWNVATLRNYRWHLLRHDKDTRLALVGLFFATAGICVDASLGVGKYLPVFPFSDGWLAAFSTLSYVLKIPGLMLAAVGVYRKQAS